MPTGAMGQVHRSALAIRPADGEFEAPDPTTDSADLEDTESTSGDKHEPEPDSTVHDEAIPKELDLQSGNHPPEISETLPVTDNPVTDNPVTDNPVSDNSTEIA